MRSYSNGLAFISEAKVGLLNYNETDVEAQWKKLLKVVVVLTNNAPRLGGKISQVFYSKI